MFETSPEPAEPEGPGSQPGGERAQENYLPGEPPNPHGVRRGVDGEAWVAEIHERPPGLPLLRELLETFNESLGDLELLTTLAAWERVAAWVASCQNDALVALAVRAERHGGPRQLAALLASELRCTQNAAEGKLALARSIALYPVVADALEAGKLDVSKARTVLEEADGAPEASRDHVAALGVALAPTKTPPQLRRALKEAVLALDPAAAAERTRRAVAERRVEFQPLPDSMALITAFLPAADAMAVKTALDALARTAGADDPRTFDQRRADGLSAIFHAILDTGEAPLHPDHLIATAASEEPASEEPTSTGAASDVDSFPTSHDANCRAADGEALESTHPEALAPADRASSESTNRDALRPAHASAGEAADDGPCESHAVKVPGSELRSVQRSREPLWRRLATTGRQRAHLQVTVAGTTLLGLDDQPGELAGYGPIPADVARQVATDATWRAVLTDPALGTVTAVGERSYRPGAVLTRDVMARDRTCTFPGCSQPSHRCDLDHRCAFDPSRPAEQQTHKDNLHALCRFHHNLKTLHGWAPTFDPPTGVTTWTSPLGKRYERHPEPALPPWENWLTQIAELPRPKTTCMCAAQPQEAARGGAAASRRETGGSAPGGSASGGSASGESASGGSAPGGSAADGDRGARDDGVTPGDHADRPPDDPRDDPGPPPF